MRQKLNKLAANIFGIFIFAGVGLGAVAFVFFIIALIIGGDSGATVSVAGKKLIDYGIRLSSVGILFGLIKIYTDGEHYLTLKKQRKEEDKISV